MSMVGKLVFFVVLSDDNPRSHEADLKSNQCSWNGSEFSTRIVISNVTMHHWCVHRCQMTVDERLTEVPSRCTVAWRSRVGVFSLPPTQKCQQLRRSVQSLVSMYPICSWNESDA